MCKQAWQRRKKKDIIQNNLHLLICAEQPTLSSCYTLQSDVSISCSQNAACAAHDIPVPEELHQSCQWVFCFHVSYLSACFYPSGQGVIRGTQWIPSAGTRRLNEASATVFYSPRSPCSGGFTSRESGNVGTWSTDKFCFCPSNKISLCKQVFFDSLGFIEQAMLNKEPSCLLCWAGEAIRNLRFVFALMKSCESCRADT